MDVRSARKILGVPADADEESIRSAYRRLARKHHPDVGGSEEEFLRIQEAYDLLSESPQEEPPLNPRADERYRDLVREAEERVAEARRQAQEARRAAQAKGRVGDGGEPEVEDSFGALLRDTLAQAEAGLERLLDRERAAEAGSSLRDRLKERLSRLDTGDEDGEPEDLSPAERELRRLRRLISDHAQRSSEPPDLGL